MMGRNILKNEQDRSLIKSIIKKRNIRSLIHFTHIKNLESIINNGIFSIKSMESKNIYYHNTDEIRLDNNLYAISLSITYPNGKMLYKKRMEYGNEFVIIKLSPAILYELNCAFCGSNAAANSVKEIPLEQRVNGYALEDMFSSNPRGSKCIRCVNLPDDMTTDEQAEVLVFGDISVEYINQVVFFSKEVMRQYGNICRNIKCSFDYKMFGLREYY